MRFTPSQPVSWNGPYGRGMSRCAFISAPSPDIPTAVEERSCSFPSVWACASLFYGTLA